MAIHRTLIKVSPSNVRSAAEKMAGWLASVSAAPPMKGGPGSGYHAPHYGRPGKRGGSSGREGGYQEQMPKLRAQWDAADTDLLRRVLTDFGFTYRPLDNTSPSSGFALSPYRDRERVLSVEGISADSLEQYLVDNADVWKRPNHYFGAWYNTEDQNVYLDVSIVVQDPTEATRLSIRHKQEAYYDIAAGETVYVRARGDEAGKSLSRAQAVELELIHLHELEHPV